MIVFTCSIFSIISAVVSFKPGNGFPGVGFLVERRIGQIVLEPVLDLLDLFYFSPGEASFLFHVPSDGKNTARLAGFAAVFGSLISDVHFCS